MSSGEDVIAEASHSSKAVWGGLMNKVARGGIWLGLGSLGEQASRFIRNMILARILSPDDFGCMAIILSVCAAVEAFTDIGIRESLIQNHRSRDQKYTETAWLLGLGRAIVVYAVLYASAPFLSEVYGQSQLSDLLRIAGMAAIADGMLSAAAYTALRDMQFTKWAVIRHGSAILGVLITIALSLSIGSVLALVLGYLAESVLRCCVSFALCPFVPRFVWHPEVARDFYNFAKTLIGLSFLNLVFMRLDIFALGKLISPAELGAYSLAVMLVQAPTHFAMNVLGQTMLSAYSRIQSSQKRLNSAVLTVMAIIVLCGIPVVGIVVMCGKLILSIAYGEPYRIAYGSMIIASVVALFNVLNGQLTLLFYSQGQPNLHARCMVVMAIVMAVLVYPLCILMGMLGAQIASLIAICSGLTLQVIRARHLTGFILGELWYMAAVASAATLLAGLTITAVTSLDIGTGRPVISLILGVAGMFLAALLGLRLVWRNAN